MKDKSPIENLDVLFQFRRDDSEPWSELSQVRTSREGVAALDLLVGGSMKFRAITQESWERTASQTEIGTIKVSRILEISPPTYAKSGIEFEILARLTPKAGEITLQRKSGSKWLDVEKLSVSDSDGTASFAVTVKNRGFAAFRVIANESEKYNGSQSEPFMVFIR